MTVDIHAHAMSESLIHALATAVPEAAPRVTRTGNTLTLTYPDGRARSRLPASILDLDARLADMDRLGIDIQALSVPPTSFGYQLAADMAAEVARLYNDALIDMANQRPDRFVVFGTLPLQEPAAAIAELDRLAKIPAVVGIEIGTNLAGRQLDGDYLADFWKRVERLGMAVLLHPINVLGADRMQGYYLSNMVGNPTETTLAATRLVLSGVLAHCPGLRIILPHGGGFLPYQIGRFRRGWDVRPEAREHHPEPPDEFLRQFYFDSILHDQAALGFLISSVGADRVCLGSDYPFDMGDPDPVQAVRKAAGHGREADQILTQTGLALITRRAAV